MFGPQYDALLARLAACVGETHVLTQNEAMAPYLVDWRGRYHGAALAVARPASTAEVAALVVACRDAGVGVVPQGGNTGLCGGATPLASVPSVVVSLARMQAIRQINALDNALTVEAGCTLSAVQAAAAECERLFPLSLASEGSCQIGGNIATNAGGVHVLRYGNMRQLVLGLEVVLPDGQVWDGLRCLNKDNTGYDLKQLFIGSEGTLGIVTAAVLKLHPRPRQRVVAWCAVVDPEAALGVLDRLRAAFGERVSAFELIGRSALEVVLAHIPGARAPLADVPDWSVLLELGDVDPDAPLAEQLEAQMAGYFDAGLIVDAVIASSLAQCDALWSLRENISEAQRLEGFSIKHDISVPVSAIPKFLRRAELALLAAFPGLRIVVFGHVGDGNLHYNLSCVDRADNERLMVDSAALNRIVHDTVAGLGGSISAEHGLGQLKRDEIVRYKSALELDLMRRIKMAIDPGGLMNPGKVLPPASLP
ncbi:MAG: FAD-binding oxidoreductase [Rhodocyclaceae bacterium]|nr:FAD-binding oxidoreductase [Rhodocyclaceae bacterium]